MYYFIRHLCIEEPLTNNSYCTKQSIFPHFLHGLCECSESSRDEPLLLDDASTSRRNYNYLSASS